MIGIPFILCEPQCEGKNESKVDWYIILLYKKEKISYTYIDSKTESPSSYDLTAEDEFLPLKLINNNNDDYITFKSKKYSQGKLIYTKEGDGVFFYHNANKFHTSVDSLIEEIETQREVKFFFCINFDNENVNLFSDMLYSTEAEVINNKQTLPLSSENTLEKLIRRIPKSSKEKKYNYDSVSYILSKINRFEVQVFSKVNSNTSVKSYDMIRDFYKTGFLTKNSEWMSPNSDCNYKEYPLLTVGEVEYDIKREGKNKLSKEDKTKWLVADKKDVVCFGDIDRNDEKELGNIFCLKSKTAAKFFRENIITYINCKNEITYFSDF